MRLCDLHTHSMFSDGSDTPEQIIEKALKIGLSAVALCDHDCVDGLPRFLNAAKNKDIVAVPGAEFSVDYNGKELHLLALFIPEDAFAELTELMKNDTELKEKSNRLLVESLIGDGYDIDDFETIKNSTPNGKFNRVEVATALMKKNYVSSIKEAFETLLSEEAGYYKPRKRITVWEMIDRIKAIGAVPVIAHPFLNLTEDELSEFLPLAKERGLVGMECYYSDYTFETTERALRMAKLLGLKFSGGSDYHGDNKKHIGLGIGRGNLKIPFEWVEALKNN